jgi:hypothetical protein
MTYNLTFMDNATGLLPLVQGVNDNSGGWFFPLILLFAFVVLMMSFNFDIKNNLLGASFITTLGAIIGWGAGLTTVYVVMLPLILLLATIMIKVWGDG